jgi:Fe-S-cluster-containing dehydrogenase component/CRP-like cAMP-binding protein
MPLQITEPNAVRQVLPQLDILSELLEEENGKPKHCTKVEITHLLEGHHHPKTGIWVDPYLRLAVYRAGEELMRQGDRDGNKLYIGVEGHLEVCITDHTGARRFFELHPGEPFGEMSLLSDAERNATISVPQGQPDAVVLEVARPALEPLRKLSKFRDELDKKYRNRSFQYLIKQVQDVTQEAFSPEEFARLKDATHVSVYGKHHTLCRKGEGIQSIILIKEGWVQREYGRQVGGAAKPAGVDGTVERPEEKTETGEPVGEYDFLGTGNCLGLDWVSTESAWEYDVTVKSRTETLEIKIEELMKDRALLDKVLRTFDKFSSFDSKLDVARNKAFPTSNSDPALQKSAIKNEITTGIIDGKNLLVMDMDKCIRCGNCSLACHQVHGHSRLVRRGIHIERPVKPGSRKIQHVLSPQVCMQCHDPECLTDCPTGAVFRDRQGMIDINAEICIGCLGCANQCPYDAISMIPGVPAPANTSHAAAANNHALDTRVAPVTQPAETKSAPDVETKAKPPAPVPIIAVKCNLCENTPLNPPGKQQRKKAYSCEENCPTGALVRVNPREYFSEIETTLGQKIFIDEKHAAGRNIHKSDPLAKASHLAGLLATLALIAWTLWRLVQHSYDLNAQLFDTTWTIRWATGYAGLTGIVGVMLYPLRKKIYRHRAGPLRYWMLAHVYLGVVAAILLLVHAGTSLGGWLTTSLYFSFDAVLLSGLFGIACYYAVPRIMTSIEEEPLLIEDLVQRRQELAEQLDQLMKQGRDDYQLRVLVDEKVRPHFHTTGYLLRQYLRRESLRTLLDAAREEFKPELESLDDKELRERLMDAIEITVTIRRADSLIYLHRLLKLWIPPHIISTALMLALMLVHIIQVYLFRLR